MTTRISRAAKAAQATEQKLQKLLADKAALDAAIAKARAEEVARKREVERRAVEALGRVAFAKGFTTPEQLALALEGACGPAAVEGSAQ